MIQMAQYMIKSTNPLNPPNKQKIKIKRKEVISFYLYDVLISD